MTQRSRFVLAAICALIASACVMLGLWQGRRLAERRAENSHALARRGLPEINLVATDSSVATDSMGQRRARATGTYDHERTIILRNRLEKETPGVHVVTPMRLEGRGFGVLVLRGFAPAADAATPDTTGFSAPLGETVRGVALPIPADGNGGSPLLYRERETWGRLDRAALQARLPYPILGVYLQVEPPEELVPGRGPPHTGFPMPVAPRGLDDGPHLGYMVQWFGIALAALAFGILVLRGRTEESVR